MEVNNFKTSKEIDKELINLLKQQGYEYLEIKGGLIEERERRFKDNLRAQLERLNSCGKEKEFRFTDWEWEWFFQEYLERKTIEENTHTIQKDHAKTLKREEERWENIYLIDKKHIHNNYLQLFNPSPERRDLVILVNGLPLVFLEIKESWANLETNFRKLDRYDRYEYLSGYSKLFRFVQLFVMSNYSETKYFSNTSNLAWMRRESGVDSENANFRLTSHWTDSENQRIENLLDFAIHFLNKAVLLNILTKYCVFTTEKKLIAMRPYQIGAVEAIVNKVRDSINKKLEGKPESRGYIWHATGSGKTLTCFKARELISQIEEISKILFIVDRKVLDSQTQREFNKFGDANEAITRNVTELIHKLENPCYKKITTTFQKLERACDRDEFLNLPVLQERVVMIFDECHRSQGGSEMGNMRRITEDRFKKSLIFGVSGTPIFGKKGSKGKATVGTDKYFTECLSAYTILDAWKDGNVLSWRYDDVAYKKIGGEEAEGIYLINETQRKMKVADWILENFEIKTKGSSFKKHFNSLFATNSFKDLWEYYKIFKEKNNGKLVISAIFSISKSNEEEEVDEEKQSALEKVIEDYNQTFKTNFYLGVDAKVGYESWREDLTRRLREVEIDILIVVNMFLTGFDSAALNTLWIDKKINEPHELIQIFSRTNRIHSELKDCGNIVSFVELREKRDEALRIYTNSENIDEIQNLMFEADFDQQYLEGEKVIKEFMQIYPNKQININESDKEKREDFVKRYNEVLKVDKKLSCYSEYKGKELLTEEEKQNYHSKYLDLHEAIVKERASHNVGERLEIPTPEIDNYAFELIRSEDVDIHYILRLIDDGEEKEVILKKLSSHTKMRNSSSLVGGFIDEFRSSGKESPIELEWSIYREKKKDEEVDILIKENGFNEDAREDIKEVLNKEDKDKILCGTWLVDILPNMSYFDKERHSKLSKAREALLNLLEKWKNYSI